jgi:hypothetical protein
MREKRVTIFLVEVSSLGITMSLMPILIPIPRRNFTQTTSILGRTPGVRFTGEKGRA